MLQITLLIVDVHILSATITITMTTNAPIISPHYGFCASLVLFLTGSSDSSFTRDLQKVRRKYVEQT